MKRITVKFDGFNEDNRMQLLLKRILCQHYEVILSDNPDYVFYNVDGKDYYRYDGIRIFCTIEAICPDFNLCDYGIGFEYLTYGDRYFRFPNFFTYPEAVVKMVDKHKHISSDMAHREFCSFVYSNSAADDMRKKLFEAVSAYRKLDSGGRYLNNREDGLPIQDKLSFESNHKFSIACENASHPGYHTEKLVEAFAAGTIPVYWGDPLVGKVFNKEAFIDVNDYDSLEDVVKRVRELDCDEGAYLKMLKEPALAKNQGQQDCDGETYLTNKLKELEDYLIYIIDQPLEKAYRRNRGFWGRQYLQNFRTDRRVIEHYLRLRETKMARILRRIKGC